MYLTQGLHRAVQQTPDAPMTVFGGRTRSFRDVADRVSRFAGALRGLGVGDGDRVAMLSLNSDNYHEYLLAVPWANAVLNPVNTRWSPAEIAYSLQDSGSRTLLIDDTFAAMLPAIREACPELATVIHTGDGPTPAGALAYEQLITDSAPIEDPRRGGDELAGLFYTGGTTGFPKGVMLSHTALLTSALGSNSTGYLLRPGGRLLHAAPMFHVADLAAWTGAMLLGNEHVIIPAFEPRAVLHAIAEHQITDVLLVPVMIQMVADHPDLAGYDLTSLRAVLYGASVIPQAVLERAMKAFPTAGFTQAFGQTELAPVATLLGPEDHLRPEMLRSAGRAAPHCEVRVVDPDAHEVPRGTVGEVAVRGANMMAGYWNKPEETAVSLRNGWVHTGDGAYMDDDGYIYVVDRMKDMIVTGGENVYSAEVENALAQHDAVASCAVIGVPDDQWGERVHAVVVLHAGRQVGVEELRDHVRALIANYKTPRTVEFVDALPISGAGKILKRELRAKYWGDGDRQVH
jgi:acyl-CoA synthetase (AMP-forming)/AMP-acid ligase II